jgi:AmmeMemoRadiSam system protein A
VPSVTLDHDARQALVAIARAAVVSAVSGADAPAVVLSERLAMPGAAFVTLRVGGELRGCIGVLDAEAHSLADAVACAARAAATEDRRFPPLVPRDLKIVAIEISVLGPLVAVCSMDEIVVGRHGLVVRAPGRMGLLLPQVATERGWDRDTFLDQTCRKAGLPLSAWRQGAPVFSFEAEVFGESGPAPAAGRATG